MVSDLLSWPRALVDSDDRIDVSDLKKGDLVYVGAEFELLTGPASEKFWVKLSRVPFKDGSVRGRVEQANMIYADLHGYKHGDLLKIPGNKILDARKADYLPEGMSRIANSGPMPNKIWRFFHCAKCLKELPEGMSPRDYAQLEVGATEHGEIQVWCKRHEMNVGVFKADIPDMKQCQGCEECEP